MIWWYLFLFVFLVFYENTSERYAELYTGSITCVLFGKLIPGGKGNKFFFKNSGMYYELYAFVYFILNYLSRKTYVHYMEYIKNKNRICKINVYDIFCNSFIHMFKSRKVVVVEKFVIHSMHIMLLIFVFIRYS